MELPETIRKRLGEFSRTVFITQSRTEDRFTSLGHNVSLLQRLLLSSVYPALPDYYKFILITVLILMTLIEAIRLYLGYAGNLQEKVPELAGFWLLTLLLQFPLTLFQLFNEAILIQPLERGVHIVLALFLLIESVTGFVALRVMVRHSESHFHLRQFDGFQELRPQSCLTHS
ncbi:transmembrane protein 17B isoform X3 [Brienomyrus brachyistius]|uniref:transmembrane protein 17B isoform X3 n=1 Tax=Brienomyrus brachyistius TaxID=42636 RepID=UPI0020B45A7C|nr:transmembrane protein 17B isoform X3 [Brienomyrus brachyistius]